MMKVGDALLGRRNSKPCLPEVLYVAGKDEVEQKDPDRSHVAYRHWYLQRKLNRACSER